MAEEVFRVKPISIILEEPTRISRAIGVDFFVFALILFPDISKAVVLTN